MTPRKPIMHPVGPRDCLVRQAGEMRYYVFNILVHLVGWTIEMTPLARYLYIRPYFIARPVE